MKLNVIGGKYTRYYVTYLRPIIFCATGEGLGNVDCGHFVLEGKILMVYRLKVMESIDRFGNIKFKLYNEKLNNRKKYVEKYMETCIFSSDSCFNIGNKKVN